MAVINLTIEDPGDATQSEPRSITKGMPAPKRASDLKYWWKDAKKILEREWSGFIPAWPSNPLDVFTSIHVDVGLIIVEWQDATLHCTLTISRKRNLR